MKSILEDIKEGTRLPSYMFTLNEHCSRQGDSPIDLWSFSENKPHNGWTYLGWAPSASTCIPNSNWGCDAPVAVLLENNVGERVWCHIPASNKMICAAFSGR